MTGITMAIDLLGTSRQRPPRAELHCVVHLANTGDEDRWVLLPDTLAAPPRSPSARVHSLAGWLMGERSTIQLLHATADAGWFAVLLPPRAELSVVGLPLVWWGEPPTAVEVVARHVADLRVNGQPVAGQLGLPGTPLADRVGDAGATADPTAVRASLEGTPHDPLHVSWADAGTAVAQLEISAQE